MPTTAENNKRIAKNTVMLYFRMIVMLLISLYTSRIVLNTLGVVDYGVNNVVGGVIAMMGFITGSLGAAMSRFITYDLGKGDMKVLKKTFGNILTIYLCLAGVIFIGGETLGLWFLNTKLQIPDDRMYAAQWVYQLSIFSTMLGVICTPYNACIVAHEKMSAFAYISIFDAVMRLVNVTLLVVIPYDKLITFALLNFAVGIIDRIIYGVYTAKNFEEVHTRPCYDKKQFKEIFAFAGWTMNGNLAVMGYTQGLNMLLNIFFGPAVNAARAIAVRVQMICVQFSGNFLTASRPQITKSYASGELTYMHKLMMKSSKFGFLILFFIALPVSLEAGQVLVWWLGLVPEHTTNFLRLVLCTSLLDVLRSIVVTCVHATGNLKKFQIVEGTMLLSIVPISYVLLKFCNTPPETVFIVHFVVEGCTQYARLRIVLPMIKLPLMEYFRQVIRPIVLVVITAPIVPVTVYCCLEKNVWSFFVVCIVCVLCSGLAIYTLGCTPHERQLAVEKTRNICQKLRKNNA